MRQTEIVGVVVRLDGFANLRAHIAVIAAVLIADCDVKAVAHVEIALINGVVERIGGHRLHAGIVRPLMLHQYGERSALAVEGRQIVRNLFARLQRIQLLLRRFGGKLLRRLVGKRFLLLFRAGRRGQQHRAQKADRNGFFHKKSPCMNILQRNCVHYSTTFAICQHLF